MVQHTPFSPSVWQNTPCIVCHPAVACLPHWCCWTLLPGGVIQHNFYKNGVIWHACVHGRRKDFIQGGTSRFFQKFLQRGAKSGEICFLPLETRKTEFFAEIFKFLPPFRHPCLCVEKSSCQPFKNWCYFKRFNTILNSEILPNLMRKMKYLTDKFQLCFCFCVGNTKQLYFFCIGNTIGILTADDMLVAAYALSCLCIPVSNAVVKWVFSHVTSVFKMWKSCDFECVWDRYQCCVIFACFSSCVLGVFTGTWRLRHTSSSGLARVFDNDLYRRTGACMLCIFVPPPTAPLRAVVDSGSFLWALSLFIYFRSIPGL